MVGLTVDGLVDWVGLGHQQGESLTARANKDKRLAACFRTGGHGDAVGGDGHGDVGEEEEEERARGEGGVVVRPRLRCVVMCVMCVDGLDRGQGYHHHHHRRRRNTTPFPPFPTRCANKHPIHTLYRARSRSCLPKVEQLADGRVRVREEERGQLIVVRAGAALERHQLRQERLVRGFVLGCVHADDEKGGEGATRVDGLVDLCAGSVLVCVHADDGG